jgi:2,3-bisphosphoglycerate-dependent phosphoglycerate mutase
VKSTVVYLVRHAHAEWRVDERRPLSSGGRAAAHRLADLFEHFPVAEIYSSPSSRAIETLSPLAERRQLPLIIVDDLRERELTAATASAFAAAVEASWRRPDVAAVANGESNHTAQGRGIAAVRDILKACVGRSVVISTHGSLLALILNGFDPAFGYDFWISLTFPDVYELTFDDSRMAGVRRIWTDET